VEANFQTSAAAEYLKSVGIPASPRWLEKVRGRGADDGRDRGPDFFRDQRGFCWYPQSSLDRYAMQRLSARTFRAPASQPVQFRRRGAGQAA